MYISHYDKAGLEIELGYRKICLSMHNEIAVILSALTKGCKCFRDKLRLIFVLFRRSINKGLRKI